MATGNGAGRQAAAVAAPAGGQAPGFYRFALGDIEVTMVNDGVSQRPLDAAFIRNAEVAEVRDALADAFQPPDTLTSPFTPTLIHNGTDLVLIDAGIGAAGPATANKLLQNLSASGYAPEQVTVVIASHFHGDHIQGIRGLDGAATFPNARLMAPEAEWAFWMDDGQMSRAPERLQAAFKGARRVFGPALDAVERFPADTEILPGITALPAYGHTPGHTTFLIDGGGSEQLLVWSDTTNKPELFVCHPDWQASFDMDGDEAVRTRKRLLDRAATDRLRVAGYHFPFPATGHIAGTGDSGYRFVPSFWMPA